MPKHTSPQTCLLYLKLAKMRKQKRGVGAYLRALFSEERAKAVLKEFNVSYSTVEAGVESPKLTCSEWNQIIPSAEPEPEPEPVGEEISLKVEGDSAVLTAKKTIRTEAELLAECKVDLNVWEVASCEVSKWDMGRKAVVKHMTYRSGVADGESHDSGKVNIEQMFRVLIRLKKREGAETVNTMLEHYRDELARAGHPDWSDVGQVNLFQDRQFCLELAIPDLHLGKLSWGPETNGANYNSAEAISYLRKPLRV